MIFMLSRLRDERFRVRHAAMAGAAGDDNGGFVVFQLREVFGVDVFGHFDHQARFFFDRICVGGEVVAFGLRVFGVAKFAFDA